MTKPSLEQVQAWLKEPTHVEDLEGSTRGQMLASMLCRPILLGDGFSGKRPWGNSGVQSEIAWDFSDLDPSIGKVDRYEYGPKDVEVTFNLTDPQRFYNLVEEVVGLLLCPGLVVPETRT